MTSNMIYVVGLGVGLKCSSKIHLNTQLVGRVCIVCNIEDREDRILSTMIE